MNYGMLYYGSLVAIGGAVITWTFVWSHKVRERRKQEKFLMTLGGYKFGSLKELQDYWRGTLDISFDGDFDELRHGSKLETLKAIDEAATKEWKRWNS